MTTPQFSRPGAVDLSGLQQAAGAPLSGGAYVVEVTSEETLAAEVVNRSMSVLVLLSVWAPDVPASVELNTALARIADESAGRFLLATLDARANAQLVASIGIPSVPLVAAVLRGQIAPLIQQALPEAELRALVQQVVQAAAANGITGRVEPRAPVEAEGAPALRFPAAEEALVRGDVETAVREYQAALDKAPGDPEAVAGLARAKLLQRMGNVDAQAVRSAAAERPDDVSAQTAAADLDLIGGHVDDACARLLDVVRRTSGADREAARRHLLELFAVVGDADPRVAKARRALTAALF